MVFVGHLDTMRLFERASRRASLPLTHDKSPFRARPRIATALPLPLGMVASTCLPACCCCIVLLLLFYFFHCCCCIVSLLLLRFSNCRHAGATSDAEVLELLLTRPMALEELRGRLQAQLPAGVQLLGAREVPIFKADGSNYEKLGGLLKAVEYHVLITRTEGREEVEEEENEGGKEGPVGPSLQEAVAAAVKAPVYSKQVRVFQNFVRGHVMLNPAYPTPTWRQDKKRNNKVRDVDVGAALLALEVVPDSAASPLARWAGDVLTDVAADAALADGDWGVVRLRTRCAVEKNGTCKCCAYLRAACRISYTSYIMLLLLHLKSHVSTTSCDGGNPVVTPAVLCALLSRASGAQWTSAHVHRNAVEFGESTPPRVDHARLRSILLWEGHVAIERLWRGTGPWAAGIEGRPMAASSNEQ